MITLTKPQEKAIFVARLRLLDYLMNGVAQKQLF